MKRKDMQDAAKEEEEKIHHDDSGGDKNVGTETTCNVVAKKIYFCFGQHGVISWNINLTTCGTFATMNWNTSTFCIAQKQDTCKHLNDTTNLTLSFYVSYDDVLCFMLLVSGKCDHIIKFESQEHNFLISGEINFIQVLKMFEFFQTEKKCTEILMKFLAEQRSFKSAVSCLSAYHLIGKCLLGTPSNILFQEHFKLLFRLKTAMKHGQGSLMYNTQIMDAKLVAKTLAIDISLTSHLNEKCIIAGGGALFLGCPSSKFDLTSDVDLFILQSSSQMQMAKNLIVTLRETGHYIFQLGKGVISAIGKYGTRRVQIVLTKATNADDLILGFDFPAVCAYYDGSCLYATVGAHYSWLTKKCYTNVNYRRISAMRLLKLHWKGFSLKKQAIEYLKNSIFGWPVKEETTMLYASAIPYLVSNDIIPLPVQYSNIFKAFDLVVVHEENDIETIDRMIAFNPTQDFTDKYANYENVFSGSSLDEYIKTCTIDPEFTKKGPDTLLHLILSDYVFEVSSCFIFGKNQKNDEKETKVADEGEKTKNIKKKVCVGIRDTNFWQHIKKEVPAYFKIQLEKMNSNTTYTTSQSVDNNSTHFYARYSQESTEFFENGFAQLDLPCNFVFPGKIFIRPLYLIISTFRNDISIHWQASQIYWSK